MMIKKIMLVLLISLTIPVVFCKDIKQPRAKKEKAFLELHNQKILDEYQWLQDKKNPETRKYAEEENFYTKKMMQDTNRLVEKCWMI